MSQCPQLNRAFKLICGAFLSTLLQLTCIPQVLAQSSQALIDEGINLFKKQNFEAALLLFDSAYQQGDRSTVLIYNLGVTRFKLGLYDLAIENFKSLQGTPLADLGMFNEGLCLEAKGDTAAAATKFRMALRSKNEKVRVLAEKKLAPTDTAKAAPQKTDPIIDLSGLLLYLYGHDDALTLPDEAEQEIDPSIREGDDFQQIFVLAKLHLPLAIDVFANYLDLAYVENSNFDFGLQKLGIERSFDINDWEVTPSFASFRSQLGLTNPGSGHDYQEGTSVSLSTKKTSTRLAIYASYDHTNYQAQNLAYIGSEGTRQRFRLDLTPKVLGGKVRVRFQHEINDRKDTETASFSPKRNTLALRYDYDWNRNWGIRTELRYRASEYPGRVNAFALLKENRLIAETTLQWTVNRNIVLDLKYQSTDHNSDSDSDSDNYTRNVISVGLRASRMNMLNR